MAKAHFGMIGLGTMGRNFLLNIAEHGISGIGYDLDAAKRELLLEEGKGGPLDVGTSLLDFLAKLESPRNIMLLVPAGPIVDSVIADLAPHLDNDDLIIDGGNSHFTDTERRETELAAKGIGFMGVGVSGGEEGARHGASIMPGGKREHYNRIEQTLKAVSAKVNDEPCVAYMGASSAGHFVKMVHNGIEYGLMQILSETFDFMQNVLKMDYPAMATTFSEWNNSELNSFLVEITAQVMRKTDPETGNPLVSMILDTAGQKGTGKWTSQAAMDLGIPIPTIDSAVSMRQISSQKAARVLIAAKFAESENTSGAISATLEDLRQALISAFVITYAQGLALLQAASTEKNYGVDIAQIAKIWRGGCIIRSTMLEDMRVAYAKEPKLANLILDDKFAGILSANTAALRRVIQAFAADGIPSLCFSSALSYFEAIRTERLPANLIQAQRDFFGAHTYQRTDKDGIFHTPDWEV